MKRAAAGSALVAFVILALTGIGPVLLGTNFRAVVPDRVYRSGQLSPEELEERIERHRIRSIVNLRGDKEDRRWYREEVEVARRRGVLHRSLDLVPERLPPRPAVAALIDSLERLPPPILIHCSAGADRTGFASVIAKMALGGAPYAEARKELSFWHGHVPFGPSAEIGRIFDLYEESEERREWKSFERWARSRYVPYVYSARIEVGSFPAEVAPGERIDLRLRATNTSPGPWILRRDEERGIKLGVRLRKKGEAGWLDYDRHAQLDSEIAPGEELALEIPVQAPGAPGEYELKLDMVDEHVTWFEDQGSTPWTSSLRVNE